MKVLVTGARGQLGFDVVQELMRCGILAVGVDMEEMDITDADAVDLVVKDSGADAVIHCAAYTRRWMPHRKMLPCASASTGTGQKILPWRA